MRAKRRLTTTPAPSAGAWRGAAGFIIFLSVSSVCLTAGANGTVYAVAVENAHASTFIGLDAPAFTKIPIDPVFNGATGVDTADMDGDGDLDIVATAFDADDIAWWENADGDGGSWAKHEISLYFDGARGIHAVDVDGDGDIDVLATGENLNDIAWWENTAGNGSAWTKRTVETNFLKASDVKGVDIDGDGDTDVVAVSRQSHGVAWWENVNGSGTSWSRHSIVNNFSGGHAIDGADVDGDGDCDVLGAASSAAQITWWENADGDGLSWTKHVLGSAIGGACDVVAGDVDGDGDTDILGAASTFGRVCWWENGASWVEHAVTNGLTGVNSVDLADVDADGELDILAAVSGADEVIWWQNGGGAASWSPSTIDSGFGGAAAVHAADIDEDGYPDAVGSANLADDITLWHNDAGNRSVFFAPVWTNSLCSCSQLVAYVTNSIIDGDWTQRVLQGWSRTGCRPESGQGGVTTPFALTNFATVTWAWGVRHRLEAVASENGEVLGSNGWYQAGSTGVCEAIPSRYYHFSHWTGAIDSCESSLSLAMHTAYSIRAVFAPDIATNGTPHWWLAQHGLTNGQWDADALGDADGDGMPAWAEWQAGTNPTNAPSALKLTAGEVASGSVMVRWTSEPGKFYSLLRCVDVKVGFEAIAANIPATPGENAYTDSVPEKVVAYYRVRLDP